MSTAARAFPYFPGLLLLAILPATSMLAAEPPQSTTATTTVTTTAATTVASAPHRTVAYGGRSVELAVDAIDNPLVLMQTSAGDLVVELFQQEAPQTVATFLELANGTKAPSDPTTDSEPPHPYYDGLGFYRVINGFMIQAGNPAGVDDGNPAARFTDEISALSLGLDKMLVLDPTGVPNAVLGIRSQQDFQQRVLAPVYKSMGISSQQQIDTRLAEIDQHLRAMTVMALYELQGYHYRNELQSHAPVRGVLAVANGGPAGKGSQFFINLVDTPWLTGKHTVFGKVRLGMEIVDSIGKVAVDTNAHPLQPVTLLGIRSL